MHETFLSTNENQTTVDMRHKPDNKQHHFALNASCMRLFKTCVVYDANKFEFIGVISLYSIRICLYKPVSSSTSSGSISEGMAFSNWKKETQKRYLQSIYILIRKLSVFSRTHTWAGGFVAFYLARVFGNITPEAYWVSFSKPALSVTSPCK